MAGEKSVGTLLFRAAGFGLKLAVMPLGRPSTASVTAPVKPPDSVTVTVVCSALPGATVSAVGDKVNAIDPVGQDHQVQQGRAGPVDATGGNGDQGAEHEDATDILPRPARSANMRRTG